jgi:hypothetical protein
MECAQGLAALLSTKEHLMALLQTRRLGTVALFALGAAASTLLVFWSRPTHAEVIEESERQGEYDEDGMKFGNVVVKGELVADGSVPGGWVLVRTLENKGDETEKCAVEERVLRTETMDGARVTPTPVAVVLRNQPIALGPHEKRTIGVRLPEEVGKQITTGLATQAWIQRAEARAAELEQWDKAHLDVTYMAFHVEYLKPLRPGETAAPPFPSGVMRPGRMPM